jgi:hypothetical protein
MCLNGKADSFRPGEGNIPVSDKGKQTETSPESETLARYILWSRGNSGDPAHSPKREYGLFHPPSLPIIAMRDTGTGALSHYVNKYQTRRIGQSGSVLLFSLICRPFPTRLPPFPPFSPILLLLSSPPPPLFPGSLLEISKNLFRQYEFMV